MATTMSHARLRRLDALATIRRGIERTLPGLDYGSCIGLLDVAEACRRVRKSAAPTDWWAVRDQLLTIACEWDLGTDALDRQSDACLTAIIAVLRPR